MESSKKFVRVDFNRFSSLNLGSIDYNGNSRDLEDVEEEFTEEEISEEEDFDDDLDSAFRSHAL